MEMRTSELAPRAPGWVLGACYLLMLATNDLCGTRKLPSVSSREMDEMDAQNLMAQDIH